MQIVSVQFLVFVFLGWVLFYSFDRAFWRKAIFLGMNIFYLVSFCSTDEIPIELSELFTLVPILFFVLMGYLAVLALQKYKSRTLLSASVVSQFFLFIYLKQYSVLDSLPRSEIPFVLVGISYLFFRVIHMSVESFNGTIGVTPGLISYLNYCFSFLTLQAGPIQNWNDYQGQIGKWERLDWKRLDWSGCLSRILNGFIRALLFGSLFERVHQWSTGLAGLPVGISLSMLTYLLYLYFNFSGFMEVGIGIGALFGFQLPESFRHPLIASNYLDLWSRWNITVSEWFRDYVFTPLMTALTRKLGSKRFTVGISFFSICVSFVLMGLWHGTTQNHLLYGLMLGTGAGATRLIQTRLSRTLGKQRYLKLKESVFYKWVASSFTLSFFSFSLVFIWTRDLDEISSSLGSLLDICSTFLLLWGWFIGVRLIIFLWDELNTKLKGQFPPRAQGSELMGLSFLAFRILLVVGLVFSTIEKPIEVIYRVF